MVKKIVVLLVLALMLSGCSGKETNGAGETTPPTAPTVQTGKYDADNRIEEETDGAVKAFSLEQKELLRIESLGKHLLVFAEEDNQLKLILLSGEELVFLGDAAIPVAPENVSDITVLPAGVAYYAEDAAEVVYLDGLLRENDRVQLPEEISGKPYIASTGKVYYASDNAVREFDPDTKIPRLIRQLISKSLELSGCYFDGKVLSCQYTDANDVERWCYISSKTGKTLSEYDNLQTLVTSEDVYFAEADMGVQHQMIVGTLEGKAKSLNISREKFLGAIPSANGGIFHTEKEDILTLNFCDFSTGKCTYRVTLNGIEKPTLLCSGGGNSYIWLWAKDLQKDDNTLYRWELEKTPLKSKKVYTSKLYTAKSPDEDGLAECQKRVDALNMKYGVTIRIWENAVKVPGEHSLTPEHQVSVIDSTLTQLEEVFKLFPGSFLGKTGRCTHSGRVRICIVRDVDAQQKGVHYWDSDGDFFLVLTPGCNIRDTFLENLGYVVLTHVMGNSVEMDYWTDWNPKGFAYGDHEQDKEYLAGQKKAFIDEKSMLSVTDDRSRMLMYAMTDLGEGHFETDAMQGKLKLLSLAIRDTYRMRSVKETLPWEQYLKQEEELDKK